MNEKPIYAVIYARVSTGSEEQAGSIPTQIDRCRSYCKAMDWEIVEVCADQGITGTTLDRPGWHRVEELIQSGRANMVVATSLDRLARTDEFMPWLREVLHPANADFATIAERIDTSNAAGRLALGILVQIAQFQAEQTREKTTAAMQYRAEQGLWVVRLPFGTMHGDVAGIPVKDPETWPVVEFIYEQAAAGRPRSEILAALKDKGVRGPSGGEFGRTTLDRILGNRFYIGYVNHKGQEFKAKHKCLVSRGLWDQAQRLSTGKRGRRPEVAHYLLRGKVVTDQLRITVPEDQAGHPVPLVPYFSQSKNKQYPSYYRADRRRKYGGIKAEVIDRKATKWLPSSVPADELDEAVIESLSQLADADQRQVFMCQAENAAEKMRQEMVETKAVREKELAETRRKLKKLIERTIDYDRKVSLELIQAWDAQLEALKLKEQKLIGQVQSCDDIVHRLELVSLETEATLDQVNSIQKFWEAGDIEPLREIIGLLVDVVTVRADEKQYEVRVRLNPLPVVREVFETIPNKKEVAPTGIIRIPFSPRPALCRRAA